MFASPLMADFMEMGRTHDFRRLDKGNVKRQHFVPQLLLRGFSRRHKGTETVFQMETSSRRAPLRVPIRTAASRHRLYTIANEDGEPSNRHEGYLALVESHAAPALRRFLEDPRALSPGDRATLAFLFALQMMRTPAAGQEIVDIANSAFQMSASELFSDRYAFAARYREQYGEAADDEEIERFRLEVMGSIREGRVRLTPSQGGEFSLGITSAAEQMPMVLAFDWTLLRAQTGFITSDRGFAIHDPEAKLPWQTPSLVSSPSSETTLPLTESECLVMRPSMNCGLSVEDVSPQTVEAINLRTSGWADRHVFGASQADLVSVRVAARQHPAKVIRPKPFCQVALLEPDPEDSLLADENRRRGWPARVVHGGRVHDYIVIPSDVPHPELWAMADDLTEKRARKRAGVGDEAPFEGRIINNPLDPTDPLLPT
jgi:Protein of unknown function (DUF4238)